MPPPASHTLIGLLSRPAAPCWPATALCASRMLRYEDEVTWSTRTWQALMAQRMSGSLHLAVAWEIAVELKGVGAEEDEAALFGAAASGA